MAPTLRASDSIIAVAMVDVNVQLLHALHSYLVRTADALSRGQLLMCNNTHPPNVAVLLSHTVLTNVTSPSTTICGTSKQNTLLSWPTVFSQAVYHPFQDYNLQGSTFSRCFLKVLGRQQLAVQPVNWQPWLQKEPRQAVTFLLCHTDQATTST